MKKTIEGRERTSTASSRAFAGILDTDPKGFGFVRPLSLTLEGTNSDPYVSPNLMRRYHLRSGVMIQGEAETIPGKSPQARTIVRINDVSPEEWSNSPDFGSLTVVAPDDVIKLEGKKMHPMGPGAHSAMRIVDLFCPLGKGQRGLIVSPPKAGKTTLMQQLAHAVCTNNPGIHLMVLLIDERPEEVTEMRRSVKGEVFASSSDSERGRHVRLAQLVLEYAKRKVEQGGDVVLLLDSLTRMGRAFNLHQRGSGRTLSGGVDARALEIPKRLFGAARNIENGGSLTIIATALIETGSRMDELIFEEFKGTGNMELVLSRELADRRIFPAIDLNLSGTRREELLFGQAVGQHQALRRAIARKSTEEAMLNALKLTEQYPTNATLLSKF